MNKVIFLYLFVNVILSFSAFAAISGLPKEEHQAKLQEDEEGLGLAVAEFFNIFLDGRSESPELPFAEGLQNAHAQTMQSAEDVLAANPGALPYMQNLLYHREEGEEGWYEGYYSFGPADFSDWLDSKFEREGRSCGEAWLKLLIKYDYKLDLPVGEHWIRSYTLLHWAVFSKIKPYIATLLELGANPNQMDQRLDIEFDPDNSDWQTEFTRSPYVLYVLENPDGELDALFRQKGADIDAYNGRGNTALHLSLMQFLHLSELLFSDEERRVRQERLRRHVRILLDKGADVNLKNEDQIAPIHLAIMSKDKELVELCLNARADLHGERAYFKYIPFEWAIVKGTEELGILNTFLEVFIGREYNRFLNDLRGEMFLMMMQQISLILSNREQSRGIARRALQDFADCWHNQLSENSGEGFLVNTSENGFSGPQTIYPEFKYEQGQNAMSRLTDLPNDLYLCCEALLKSKMDAFAQKRGHQLKTELMDPIRGLQLKGLINQSDVSLYYWPAVQAAARRVQEEASKSFFDSLEAFEGSLLNTPLNNNELDDRDRLSEPSNANRKRKRSLGDDANEGRKKRLRTEESNTEDEDEERKAELSEDELAVFQALTDERLMAIAQDPANLFDDAQREAALNEINRRLFGEDIYAMDQDSGDVTSDERSVNHPTDTEEVPNNSVVINITLPKEEEQRSVSDIDSRSNPFLNFGGGSL